MVDKNEFKDETNIKPRLVPSDDLVRETDTVGNDSDDVAGKPHEVTANSDAAADGDVACNTDLLASSEIDAGTAKHDQEVNTPIDEDQLREKCLRALGTPLKKFTQRVTAPLIEHSEEVNAALGVAGAPILLFTILITLVVESVRICSGDFHAADMRGLWGMLIAIIGVIGISLGAISLLGRWFWLNGYNRLAATCFYIGSTPAKFFPQGALNSHLARRSLCALYLAQGRPLRAQGVSSQFTRMILTPEGTALSDALEAEAAARAGQTKLAMKNARSALDGFDHLGVEPYIKARLGRELFRHVGNCNSALGEYEKARECYLRALQETLRADQIDHTCLFFSMVNLARTSIAAGHIEQAQKWLDIISDETKLSVKISVALQGELLLARSELFFAAGDEEQGMENLKLADKEFSKHNAYPDLGNSALRLGKRSTERGEDAKAEAFLQRSLKVKLRALPQNHPSIIETRRELAGVLKRLGKTNAAVEMSICADHHAEAHTNDKPQQIEQLNDIPVHERDPLSVGRKIRAAGLRRQNLILGGMAVYSLWQAVTSGVRAADPFCWAMISMCLGLTALLVGLRRHDKRVEASVKHQSTQQQSVECTISFKRNTKPDHTGLALVAVLGAPLNRECIVKKEFGLVASNLSYYAHPQQLTVFMDSESPVSIKLADGFVQLAPQESLEEAHKQQSSATARFLVLGGVFTAFILGLVIWSSIAIDHKKMPEGLTAFEYYRCGAHDIQNDWSGKPLFYDLEKVKGCLDRAVEQDKNGIIGKLASKCKNAELPRTIPNREILSFYEDGVGGRISDAEAEQRFRTCIRLAPDFDWAYCSLAENLINQNKLQEAETLLSSAAKINPDSNFYLLTRAKLCRKNGNIKEAMTLIKKAVDNDPFLLSTYKELIGATLGL